MKIKNAKKIEVWQFENDNNDFCLYIDGIAFFPVYSTKRKDDKLITTRSKYTSFDDSIQKEVCEHIAELEAKEKESESSEWIEFQTDNSTPHIHNSKYRTKDGLLFQFYDKLTNKWQDSNFNEVAKVYYENYVKPKPEKESSEWVEFVFDRVRYRTKDGVYFEWFKLSDSEWRDNAYCEQIDNNKTIQEYYKTHVKPKQKQEEPVSELEMRIAVQEELLGNVVDTITDLRSRIDFLEEKDKRITRHIFELNKVLNNIQLEIMNHTKGMNFKTNPYEDNV